MPGFSGNRSLSCHKGNPLSQLYNKSPIEIQRVISLAGIPDLETGVAQNICVGACEELPCGLPEDFPERYRQASPHHLLPIDTPLIHLIHLIHLFGENDPVVPVSYLKAHIETLSKQSNVKLVIIPGAGHYEMVMPDSPALEYIKNSLTAENKSDHHYES